MTDATAVLVGLTLGLRHATDADHVVVVTALAQREPGSLRAVKVAALWALGHTLTFLGLGLLIVLGGLRVPEGFERGADLLVAAMLIGVGIAHLVRGWAPARLQRVHPTGRVHAVALAPESGGGSDWPRSSALLRSLSRARPALFGSIHGVAGSAGVALLAASTLRSSGVAAAYLALVAAGTMLGMVVLTVVMARPLGWSMKRGGRLSQTLIVAASLLSIGLGAGVLLE